MAISFRLKEIPQNGELPTIAFRRVGDQGIGNLAAEVQCSTEAV
jgi:hypothetical protein